MKNLHLFHPVRSFYFLVVLFTVASCEVPEPQDPPTEETIVGHIGNPQFNLKFTNGDKVDLDLYVETPNGTVISYLNPYREGGQLDVDCLCGDCPNGPNENIYWENGTAPSGTFKFWVEYYDSCDEIDNRSDYTLRVIKNGSIIKTYRGTLSPANPMSIVYSFDH